MCSLSFGTLYIFAHENGLSIQKKKHENVFKKNPCPCRHWETEVKLFVSVRQQLHNMEAFVK